MSRPGTIIGRFEAEIATLDERAAATGRSRADPQREAVIGHLSAERMHAVCRALSPAAGCA